MRRIFACALPAVAAELAGWQRRAERIPCPTLRRMALASLCLKRFHCEGAAVFAAPAPERSFHALVASIVALQTISDYLDNLCDRCAVWDGPSFARLHQAMVHALEPGAAPEPDLYYAGFPYRDDGGYLAALVAACQTGVAPLPGFPEVRSLVRQLAELYGQLQVHKHIAPDRRVERLQTWFAQQGGRWEAASLAWWEFGAVAGSTLPIFALLLEAARSPRPPAERVVRAYVPWVSGLHILLDYLVDLREDERHGDLNFVAYYPSCEEAVRRLAAFARAARERVQGLAQPHPVIPSGLVATYLSDPKAARGELWPFRRALLRAAGGEGACLYLLLRRLRRRAPQGSLMPADRPAPARG